MYLPPPNGVQKTDFNAANLNFFTARSDNCDVTVVGVVEKLRKFRPPRAVTRRLIINRKKATRDFENQTEVILQLSIIGWMFAFADPAVTVHWTGNGY